MSRFDHIAYDELAIKIQANLKEQFQGIEASLQTIAEGRSKSLALTKLEEAYTWCGKAIRDEQIARSALPQSQQSKGNQ